jgi:hypothetical protein
LYDRYHPSSRGERRLKSCVPARSPRVPRDGRGFRLHETMRRALERVVGASGMDDEANER